VLAASSPVAALLDSWNDMTVQLYCCSPAKDTKKRQAHRELRDQHLIRELT